MSLLGQDIGLVKTWVLVLVPLIADNAALQKDPSSVGTCGLVHKMELVIPAYFPGLVRRPNEVKIMDVL